MPANSQQNNICLETILASHISVKELRESWTFRGPREVKLLGLDVTMTHGFFPEDNNNRGLNDHVLWCITWYCS